MTLLSRRLGLAAARFTASLLATAFVATLAACGGSSDTATSTGMSSPQQASAAASAASASDKNDPDVRFAP